jgi:hypothetical protein
MGLNPKSEVLRLEKDLVAARAKLDSLKARHMAAAADCAASEGALAGLVISGDDSALTRGEAACSSAKSRVASLVAAVEQVSRDANDLENKLAAAKSRAESAKLADDLNSKAVALERDVGSIADALLRLRAHIEPAAAAFWELGGYSSYVVGAETALIESAALTCKLYRREADQIASGGGSGVFSVKPVPVDEPAPLKVVGGRG